jgi:transcriptional regulator with PAS, ATPase and Fis domain
VNCSAIPETLIEAELFGYVRGAFTGALAQGRRGYFDMARHGTLFLDEIGEAPAALQAKLLRVLETGDYQPVGSEEVRQRQCRIIAASNRELPQEAAQGRFRLDLLHRLSVLVLQLPSLRAREGDIGFFLDRFLERLNQEYPEMPGFPKQFSAEARRVFLGYHWPGNVRELEHAIRRACCITPHTRIEAEDARRALRLLAMAPTNPLDRPLGEDFRLKDVILSFRSFFITLNFLTIANLLVKLRKFYS